MKILLAVDGSKYSEAAIQAIEKMIRKEGTEILVLQIVEPRIFSTPPQMAAGFEPELAEIMKEQFKQAQETVDSVAKVLRAAGLNTKIRVVEAETRAGLERFMLGSVAESVARGAYCSVLIVRAGREAPRSHQEAEK